MIVQSIQNLFSPYMYNTMRKHEIITTRLDGNHKSYVEYQVYVYDDKGKIVVEEPHKLDLSV